MTFQNKRLTGIVLTVIAILLIPLTAMQLQVDGVDWKLQDFVLMGILLLGTGLLCELVMRSVKKTQYQIALVTVLLLALFLTWLELAVGVFGSPVAGS